MERNKENNDNIHMGFEQKKKVNILMTHSIEQVHFFFFSQTGNECYETEHGMK